MSGKNHSKMRQRLEIEHRRKTVEANLLAGLTYREIAAALNVSVGTIAGDYRHILRAWRDTYTENIEARKLLQLHRYTVLLNGVWEMARTGNLQAIDRALHIMDKLNVVGGVTDTGKQRDPNDWEAIAIEEIRAGRIHYDVLAEEFDGDLATRLFAAAGVPISPPAS